MKDTEKDGKMLELFTVDQVRGADFHYTKDEDKVRIGRNGGSASITVTKEMAEHLVKELPNAIELILGRSTDEQE